MIYWLVRCLQPLLIGMGTQGQWPPRGGSKSGWVEAYEVGTSDARQWGSCFVTIGSGVLCFAPSDCSVRLMALRECTLLDPDGRVEPYEVRLRRDRGARPSESPLLSAIDIDGAELVLRSDTPSSAAQWRSALLAMMARRPAEGPPMARPRSDSACEAEQLLMRLVVRPIDAVVSLHASAEQRLVPGRRERRGAIDGGRLTSLASVARASVCAAAGLGAGFDEETPLLQLSAGRLGYVYDVRLHDLYMGLNVHSLSATCAAERAVGRPQNVQLLMSRGDLCEEGRLLQVVLRSAAVGSPEYGAAGAQQTLLAELQTLGVQLEPRSVQTLGGLVLRIVQKLEQKFCCMEAILPKLPMDVPMDVPMDGGDAVAHEEASDAHAHGHEAADSMSPRASHSSSRSSGGFLVEASDAHAHEAAGRPSHSSSRSSSADSAVVVVVLPADAGALETQDGASSPELRREREAAAVAAVATDPDEGGEAREARRAREAVEAAQRRALLAKPVFAVRWLAADVTFCLCESMELAEAAAAPVLCEVQLGGMQGRLLIRDVGLRNIFEAVMSVGSLGVLGPTEATQTEAGLTELHPLGPGAPRTLVARMEVAEVEAMELRSGSPVPGRRSSRPTVVPAVVVQSIEPEPQLADVGRPRMVLARERNGLPTQTEARTEGACWEWLPRQHDAAAAGPPVLALSARALDPAAVGQMGHEMEVSLTLLPLRVVLYVPLLVRAHACLVASLGGFREAVDRAARTAVADAVQDDGALDLSPVPLVQLRMLLHGPLVVLPSPSVPCAAVLLRLGDVHLHNEFEHKACARKQGAPAVYESVQARLCASQLLVAGDGNKVLDAAYNLLPGCRPHWALQESELSVTLDHMRRCEEADGAAASGTAGSTPGGAEAIVEPPPEIKVSVGLSPVHLSLAYSEVLLVCDLAKQLAPLLQPADDSMQDTQGAERGDGGDRGDMPLPLSSLTSPVSGLTALHGSSPRSTSPLSLRSVRVDEPSSGSWTARLGVLLLFECEQGVWLRLLDDSEGATLPLAELGLRQLFGQMRCSLGRKGGGGGDGGGGGGGGGGDNELLEGDAQLTLQLQASNFNPRNGAWEPVLEPWSLYATWDLSASLDPLARATAGGAPVPHMLHTLSLTASERLELNVTHAMVCSLLPNPDPSPNPSPNPHPNPTLTRSARSSRRHGCCCAAQGPARSSVLSIPSARGAATRSHAPCAT